MANRSSHRYDDLPLLDSFLKESGRMNPLDSRKFTYTLRARQSDLLILLSILKLLSNGEPYHRTLLLMELTCLLRIGSLSLKEL